MKKGIIALAAALVMSMAATAQDRVGGMKTVDASSIMKKRTETMVEKYKLNEEQAAKLQTLNEEFGKNLGPMMRMGNRGRVDLNKGDRNGNRGNRGEMRRRDAQPQDSASMARRAEMQNRREEMRKAMDEYNNKLQEIMTPEQFEQYKADAQKNRRRPGRR